ncbi:hypothetical protein MVES1_001952 [Malassezia vespertilionis]|uniref:uncharacterized protein n=1 Tax=Malassezia vespertilionis TaxID=2020962 RepID=UPI0024B1BE6A|nr:uncharacterized protein MVES1_001952 [Malassezia vespertilionis]WFD06599.1 hypothetical protein MVES1_001952 [Malassezia vespertilionis]
MAHALDVRIWPQARVLEWLRGLELEQYVGPFAANDIDGEALVLLDEASLRDLGVQSVGHRVALLSEIYRLKMEHGVPLESGDWVPLSHQETDVNDVHRMLQERDDRIQNLESRVAQLNAALTHMHEELGALTQAHRRTAQSVGSVPESMPLQDRPSPAIRSAGWTAYTPEHGAVERSASFAPVNDAVASMLLGRNGVVPEPIAHTIDYTSMDEPCGAVLSEALRRYHVRDDWREYALFLATDNTERCLSYDEKPIAMYTKMRDGGQTPVFIVRPLREIDLPIVVAERKLAARRNPHSSKQPAMRLRASLTDMEEHAGAVAQSVSHWLRQPKWSGARGEEALRRAVVMGPAENFLAPPRRTFAIAIYPYESERDDEFDVKVGDTFIILSKTKGWWALRRDSVANGEGDIIFPVQDHTQPDHTPRVEIWTGWAPAGCLLETTRPMAEMVYAGGITSPASSIAHTTIGYNPLSPTQVLHAELANAPISLSIVSSAGTRGVLLVDYSSDDGHLQLRAGDLLRVFKRYVHGTAHLPGTTTGPIALQKTHRRCAGGFRVGVCIEKNSHARYLAQTPRVAGKRTRL